MHTYSRTVDYKELFTAADKGHFLGRQAVRDLLGIKDVCCEPADDEDATLGEGGVGLAEVPAPGGEEEEQAPVDNPKNACCRCAVM